MLLFPIFALLIGLLPVENRPIAACRGDGGSVRPRLRVRGHGADAGLAVEPAHAVYVYSGREAWQAANGDRPYGRPLGAGPMHRPGLHVFCLELLRNHGVQGPLS